MTDASQEKWVSLKRTPRWLLPALVLAWGIVETVIGAVEGDRSFMIAGVFLVLSGAATLTGVVLSIRKGGPTTYAR